MIVDTGPLVAGLVQRDSFHEWATIQIRQVAPPLLTCEAVITEACYLLREFPEGVQQLATFLEQGVIEVDFLLSEHRARVFTLMRSYRDVPMSFADACLVCMVENLPDAHVFTLDGDFKIYRQHGRKQIPLIAP
ncbi:MAG: PIN domain-containing protein [Verrucomicrobiota bacterium]